MLQPRLYPAVLLTALLAVAQTPATQNTPKSDLTLRTGAQEVMLDLVIRDKNQKLVRNLKPEEIQILVDGVPQPVKSFRTVAGREAIDTLKQEQKETRDIEGQAQDAQPAKQRVEELNLVAIVFGGLGQEARGGARGAMDNSREYARAVAKKFVERDLLPNTYVAVLTLGRTAKVVENFTNSRADLEKAFTRAVMMANTPVGDSVSDAVSGTVPSSSGPDMLTKGPPSSTNGMMEAMRELHEMEIEDMLDTNYQVGVRGMMALLSLTRSLGRLPGRKTVLYVTPGLIVPAESAELLDLAISEANRAHVSFYTVDPRGLTSASHIIPAVGALNQAAAMSAQQAVLGQKVTTAMAKQDDLVYYSVKAANRMGPMDKLAAGTGGFLIADTNNPMPQMERIMEDVREHYEVTFAPTSMNFDGKFRKIEVQLARKGLQVQGRSGYYDLPSIPGQTVMPYELSALNALSAKQPPKGFPFHVENFRYRPGANGTLCVLAVEIPLSAMQPHANEDRVSTQLHGTFLALVKDTSGQVVSKVSRELRYTLANERLEAVRKGVVTVTQLFDVPAGRYTVESAVSDAIGGQASTKRNVFVVEPHSELALSDIAVARRVEALTEERNPHDPLEFAGGKVTPSPNDTVDPGAATSLYFQIYPSDASSEKPELTLSFYVDGQPVARQKPELPKPDPDGTIPFLATARMNPGTYMVRATVKQGSLVKSEESTITVQ